MYVREGMSTTILTVGPGHTLRHAARLMDERSVGAAVVLDPDADGPGIITERDVLQSVARGQDPDAECVSEHLTRTIAVAAPGWSLEQAAAEMVRRRIRHLLVVDGGEIVGVLSMRDIVRCWTTDGATSELDGAPAVA
jgi:signal-transduction protein with cAMP-binding, CBS, and nucleotidyltransferase domain